MTTRKYKFRKEKNMPAQDEINRYKNFSDLINTYNDFHNYRKATRPLYKNKKFMGVIILVIIVLMAIFLS
jgi:hypothetical protein